MLLCRGGKIYAVGLACWHVPATARNESAAGVLSNAFLSQIPSTVSYCQATHGFVGGSLAAAALQLMCWLGGQCCSRCSTSGPWETCSSSSTFQCNATALSAVQAVHQLSSHIAVEWSTVESVLHQQCRGCCEMLP